MKKFVLFSLSFAAFSLAHAQSNVGIGTNDPKSKLDIEGGLSLREGSALGLTNGNNDNIALTGNYSFYRITGPTAAFSILGVIPNSGADGQVLTLVNTTPHVMTIKNNASATAAYSIRTLTGGDIASVAGGSSVTMQYNKTEQRWYVTGSQNFTVSSGSFATSDIKPGTNSAVTVTNGTGKAVGAGDVVLDVTVNGLNQKGIVPGPTGLNASQAWITDGAGNPAWAKVPNANLQNSSVTVNTGTGLSGGGNVSLGGTLNIVNTAPDQTVTLTGGGINTVSGTYPNFTVTGTEADGSVTNEAQTISGSGTSDISLSQAGGAGGGTITLQGTGATSVTRSGNTFTINSVNSGGDITDVVAGTGLAGGGSSGSVTLDVGAGSGITVNANDVAVNYDNTTIGISGGKLAVIDVPSGDNNYIWNTTTTQSGSNFNISGTGTAIGGYLWGTLKGRLSTDQGSSIELGGSGAPYIDISNDNSSDYDVRLQLTGDDALMIDGGRLGVATSNPAATVSVAGNLGVSEPGNTGGRLLISSTGSGAEIFQNDNSPILFKTATGPQEKMRIQDNGNVGIGNSAPAHKLEVAGNIKNTGHLIQGPLVARPLATWSVGGTSNGAVLIYLPGNTGNYGMLHIEVDVYEYGTEGVTTYILGGHNWNGQWYNYNCHTIGNSTKKVRLAVKNGQYVIVLGEYGSTWSYGHVVLSKITNGGYYSGTIDLGGTYTAVQDNNPESYSWISADLNKNILEAGGGATNYLARWTSPTTLGIGTSYDNGTNVGIGTTSPGAKLHVAAGDASYGLFGPNSSWGGYLYVGAGTSAISSGRAQVISTNGNLHLDAGNGQNIYMAYYNGSNTFINAGGGSVGIGTTDPRGKVHITGGHLNLGSINDPSVDQGNNWLTWGYRADNNPYYAIRTNYKTYGSYTYSRLQLNWHTGVEIGASSTYGGTRFFNDAPGVGGSQIMSIGDGDNHVRVNNYLFAQYLNSSDNAIGSGVTGIMAKQGDNYLRTADAASVRAFLGITAPTGDNLGNHVATTTLNMNGNAVVNAGRFEPYGIGGNSGQPDHSYAIFQEGGNWSSPYPDLRIAYHTGIKLGAHYSYNGIRFYNNSDMVTQTMSVNDGDNNVRVYYGLYSPIMWDMNDGNYYSDPNGGSRLNTIHVNDGYSYGWWRNYNAGNGLYNQATGRHFYSADGNYWTAESPYGMIFRNGYESTVQGYVYANNGGGSFGLLSPNASWRVRVDNSNVETYGNGFYSVTSYLPYIYDRDNTGYYVDPAGNSQVSSVYANNWFRSQGQSGLYFQDYCGGWWMTDADWVRNYCEKSTYLYQNTCRPTIRADQASSCWYAGEFRAYDAWAGPAVISYGYNVAYDYYYLSSRSYKKDITKFMPSDYNSALAFVNNLDLNYYRYKKEGDYHKIHVGLIAEETPNAITAPGKTAVSYGMLSVYNTGAIKALSEKLEQVQKNISDFGSSALSTGEVWVSFSPEFVEQLAGAIPVVTATPTSVVDIMILETNANGFKVRSDKAKAGTFNWIAMAKVNTRGNDGKMSDKFTQMLQSAENDTRPVPYRDPELNRDNMQVPSLGDPQQSFYGSVTLPTGAKTGITGVREDEPKSTVPAANPSKENAPK